MPVYGQVVELSRTKFGFYVVAILAAPVATKGQMYLLNPYFFAGLLSQVSRLVVIRIHPFHRDCSSLRVKDSDFYATKLRA